MLYPPSLYCICCGNIIDETRTYNLCDHCISHIRWNGREEREIGGMRAMWCVYYGIYERTIIFSLKYNGKKYIARDIANIMADKLGFSGSQFDAVVPVPVSREREAERGFNHMTLVAKHLSRLTNKPYYPEFLIRTKETLPMRGLSPAERRENIAGSVALNGKYGNTLQGKKILLIDDFYTTGSTAEECGRVLREAKPLETSFLAFAARQRGNLTPENRSLRKG